MKRTLIIIFISFFLQYRAQAQEGALNWGGLGYAHAGLAVTNVSDFNDLISQTLLVEDPLSSASLSFGGGGFALLGTKYIVEGGGYALYWPSSYSQDDIAIQGLGGGGGLNFGYAVYNAQGKILAPMVGLGGMALEPIITNESQTTQRNLGNLTLKESQEVQLRAGHAYLNTAIMAMKFRPLGSDGDMGGIAAGLQVGFQLPLTSGTWQWVDGNSETEFTSEQPQPEEGQFGVFYVRLCIGGGGFLGTIPSAK